MWYNPPYNCSLKTNFGKQFLKLIKKHFPLGHKLRPIINKNNVKLSYSTTKNVKRTIQNHNGKILKKNDNKPPEKDCSCPNTRKDKCPIDNRCLKKSIVYKATIQNSEKFYIGVTESEFKKRHTSHKFSFKHETHKNATTLSQHVWEIGDNITPQNPEPAIKWEILSQSHQRKAGDTECPLCLEEKLHILKESNNPNCLNKRSELPMRCIVFHRAKHKLANLH